MKSENLNILLVYGFVKEMSNCAELQLYCVKMTRLKCDRPT